MATKKRKKIQTKLRFVVHANKIPCPPGTTAYMHKYQVPLLDIELFCHSPNSCILLYFVLAYKTTAEVKVAGKIPLNHWSPLWVNSGVGF